MQYQTRLNIAEARIKLDESQVSVFTSKFKVMVHHIYYIQFALRFADMQIPELVSVFNRQVGLRSWSSMRAYHDCALIDEFERRGIDTSSIHNGRDLTFSHPVRYDLKENRLFVIN